MTDGDYADGDAGTDSEPVVRSRDGGETASESVVRAVSEATGTDPLRMPQLGTVIDPDALDALFLGDSGWADGNGDRSGTVAFRFNGCDVTVHGDGHTVVSRATAQRP